MPIRASKNPTNSQTDFVISCSTAVLSDSVRGIFLAFKVTFTGVSWLVICFRPLLVSGDVVSRDSLYRAHDEALSWYYDKHELCHVMLGRAYRVISVHNLLFVN